VLVLGHWQKTSATWERAEGGSRAQRAALVPRGRQALPGQIVSCMAKVSIFSWAGLECSRGACLHPALPCPPQGVLLLAGQMGACMDDFGNELDAAYLVPAGQNVNKTWWVCNKAVATESGPGLPIRQPGLQMWQLQDGQGLCQPMHDSQQFLLQARCLPRLKGETELA
jgi:hypothetical protein